MHGNRIPMKIYPLDPISSSSNVNSVCKGQICLQKYLPCIPKIVKNQQIIFVQIIKKCWMYSRLYIYIYILATSLLK